MNAWLRAKTFIKADAESTRKAWMLWLLKWGPDMVQKTKSTCLTASTRLRWSEDEPSIKRAPCLLNDKLKAIVACRHQANFRPLKSTNDMALTKDCLLYPLPTHPLLSTTNALLSVIFPLVNFLLHIIITLGSIHTPLFFFFKLLNIMGKWSKPFFFSF